MGTPLQVERPFPSISPYSQNDSHVSTSQQQPTPAYYDSINDHPYGHMFSSPYVNPPRPRTSADASTKQTNGMGMMSASLGDDNNISGGSGTAKRTNKTHVPSACVNCKRAHLACDISRPCKRCVALGKVDTCIDIKHKKRGRPKLKDKKPHPYNTHATADAKTWGSSAQFLPPTTTNPNQPSLHQQNDQPPPPSNSHSFPSNSHTFPSNSHAFPSRHNLQHNHHHRQHPYVIKSPSIPRSQHLQQEHPPTITMFLTIDSVVCARVSEECLAILGYYPLELVHQSLYNYVHPQDIERVQKMVSSLFEDANRYYNQSRQAAQYPLLSPSSDLVTTDDPGFLQTHPETLQYPAGGGPMIETSDMIHMKQRIGQYDLFDVRMYLGGGLGANLTRRETWNKLYVVAFFTRVKQGTCLTNEGSNYQSRMNVGGFSTPITSPPASTIDPALLTMQHNASPSLGVGRSGLISPILSPRQVPEIGSTSLYGEVNHPIPIFHRKSLQDHETFVSRPNPMISTVSRPESFVSPSTTIPISYERRSSFRSTCDGTLSAIPFYNEMESKALDIPSYANQSNRSHHYSNAVTFNHGDIRSSPSLNNPFPKFQNDEVVEEMIMPPMPRASSSRVGTVGDDSIPTRMSVNSLLC